MKKPVALFVINGLGLGNSTRCYALMQKLAPMMEIHVFTSGNGIMFLQGRKEVSSITPSEAYFYTAKEGGISAAGTLASISKLYGIYRRKTQQLDDLLDKLRPDVMIMDSEYSVGPARKRGVPAVALNNSDVVVSEYLRRKDLSPSIRSQFWLVEYSDYSFHKWRVDMAISPSLFPAPPRHKNFRRVGVMLREEFEEAARNAAAAPFPSPRKVKRAVFMLSGSVFASQITGSFADLPYEVEVVGRDGVSAGNVKYHGKTLNSAAILKRADVLVVNGGFLAVSEAAALRKPTFVIPVPNHAEQVINALALKDAGIGYVTDETSVIGLMKRLHDLDRWEGLSEPSSAINFNGSAEAAEALLRFLRERGRG